MYRLSLHQRPLVGVANRSSIRQRQTAIQRSIRLQRTESQSGFSESVDKVESSFSQVCDVLSTELQQLEEDQIALQNEKAKFEEMKKLMSSVEVDEGDVLTLNVGGQKFTTLCKTLRCVKGSVLERMFDKPWFEKLPRDEEGHVFLDWNPDAFSHVLKRLRSWSMAREDPSLQQIKQGGKLQLSEEDYPYYQLFKYLQLLDAQKCSHFHNAMTKGSLLYLDKDDKTLAYPCTDNMLYNSQPEIGMAFGKEVAIAGLYKWDLVFTDYFVEDKSAKGFGITIGIVDNSTYNTLMLRHGAPEIRDPRPRPADNLLTCLKGTSWKKGDAVHLELDCDLLELTCLYDGKTSKTKVPKNDTGYRLAVAVNQNGVYQGYHGRGSSRDKFVITIQ